MASTMPAHLEPSELGTKEYWDDFYSVDLSTPPSPTASLDGWFSDVNASSKVLGLLQANSLGLDQETTSFLDLGTGNGEMLFLLREKGGFEGPMLGVDFCASSVELAREIATGRGIDDVRFKQWNVMCDEVHEEWPHPFDVVLDKGTFDAISLSEEKDAGGRRLCEGYRARVGKLIKQNGYLVITSCNWTKSELMEWFSVPKPGDFTLEVCNEVSYPTFSFGGHVGQSISTLCFKKTISP